MLKCPFCHFENEEGALYCEQCKSDLAGAVPAMPAIPVAQAETLPLGSVPEAAPVLVEAVAEAIAEPIPMAAYDTIPIASAEPIAPIPVMAEPIAPIPVALQDAMPVVTAQPMAPPPAPAAPPPAAATPAPPAASTPAPPPAAPAPEAAKPAEAAPPTAAAPLPAGAQPRLLVLRGQKRNVEYPIYEGLNFIGRADEKPVDIDLEDQEPPDRIWCSRQHACISFENEQLAIEDLNSANGTYVNRGRIYPGQKRPLAANDIVQIGNVQMKVVV